MFHRHFPLSCNLVLIVNFPLIHGCRHVWSNRLKFVNILFDAFLILSIRTNTRRRDEVFSNTCRHYIKGMLPEFYQLLLETLLDVLLG